MLLIVYLWTDQTTHRLPKKTHKWVDKFNAQATSGLMVQITHLRIGYSHSLWKLLCFFFKQSSAYIDIILSLDGEPFDKNFFQIFEFSFP